MHTYEAISILKDLAWISVDNGLYDNNKYKNFSQLETLKVRTLSFVSGKDIEL